ncbi:cytochrome c peroxidase [Oryzisolibacter sp. LB2S]|uniref:cytochrome-c peroxidase n=1 Tax=Alicycliphilus soli TaxID=3228789 RepID=UPI0034584149
MKTRPANRLGHHVRCAVAACAMLLGLSGAMAQTASIESNATTRLAQSRAPDSAVGRLLQPVNNSAFACGTADGWDAACLRQRYQGQPPQWPRPLIDAGKQWTEMSAVPQAKPPATAKERARLELGTALFFDVGLSRKGGVSCASCHQSGKSFTDGRAQAVGEDRLMGRRRAQTLFAAPFASQLFWDGRAASLEEQAKGSITNPFEMNNTLAAAVRHANAQPRYRRLARDAWGHERMSEDEMVHAIATFVRTVRPPQTMADEVIAGHPQRLSDQQLLGLHLFRTKARCMNCHSGPLLTDNEFHDLGLSFYNRRNQDLGRFEATRDKADLGKFRTPSLRGVSHAGPWMHNGMFADLPGLMRLYNAGMGVVTGDPQEDPYVPTKSAHIKALELNAQEIDALVEWLRLL